MADAARSDPPAPTALPDAVVRPLSRAAARRCSRPGCPTPATATLTFRYDERDARIDVLAHEPRPERYDLCGDHADRTRAPYGWDLTDARPDEPDVDVPSPHELGSPETVAVLAAALRGDEAGTATVAVEPPRADGAPATGPAVDEADTRTDAPRGRDVPAARRP